MKAAVAVALAALALAACSSVPDESWPIAEKWNVAPNASPECKSAARRATRYCVDKAVNSDDRYSSECTKARWDHARHC
jgi:hypothetical protein